MSRLFANRWTMLVIANVILCAVLGFYQPTTAAPKEEREPFANSVQQRAEMIALLKEVNAQLKQQNELLGSGKLTVVVAGAVKEAVKEE